MLGAACCAAAGAAAACSSSDDSPVPHQSRGGTAVPASTSSMGAERQSSTAPPSSSVASSGPDIAALQQRFATKVPTQWGLDVDGVETHVADRSPAIVALTFDACGGPHADTIDPALLGLLQTEAIPATLFLNSRWVTANDALTRELAANPLFEIANHGTRHVPLSMTGQSAYGIKGTASLQEVVDEVWTNHELLTRVTGTAPRWFRSGTAHYDEVSTAIVAELGERPVGFVVNGDAGATLSAPKVTHELLGPATSGGGIVIMHIARPGSGTAQGLGAALDALRARGTRFVTLSEGGGVTR